MLEAPAGKVEGGAVNFVQITGPHFVVVGLLEATCQVIGTRSYGFTIRGSLRSRFNIVGRCLIARPFEYMLDQPALDVLASRFP